MHIQWCLKGIAERPAQYRGGPAFSDAEAKDVLSSGVLSNAIFANAHAGLIPALSQMHESLSNQALNDHVNNYPLVGHDTPYVSLSAGVVLPASVGGVTVLPAWQTAVAFATNYGTTSGYVYRCWCIVSPKGIPDIAAVADEVRDLNIFRKLWIFQDEGEIAAKLVVPARHIECVHKVGANLRPENFVADGVSRINNPDFVVPDRLSNVVEAIV